MFDDLINVRPPAVDGLPQVAGQDDYQIDTWLDAAVQSARQGDDAKRSQALAACYQLYAAYNQALRERQWYRKAGADAMERGTKLRSALVALLESLGGESPSIEAFALPDEPITEDIGDGTFLAQHVFGEQDSGESPPGRTFGGSLSTGSETGPCPPHGSLDWWLPAQPGTPGLAAYLLRPFSVFVDDHPISDIANRRSKSVLKYLLLNRQRPVTRELLWNTFWPDASQEAARNNLNVALCSLRKSLANGGGTGSHIVFCNGQYQLSEELSLWVDVEAFDQHVEDGLSLERAGDLRGATGQFRAAAALYHCDLLDEDRYDDWLAPVRQRYRERHLDLLRRLSGLYFDEGDYGSCAATGNRVLTFEPCDEQAHRLLMRCYARMRHIHLALRQFHVCVGALSEELNVAPSVQTVELFRQIKLRQPV
jgi:DNA-binding SARP family transcriptional activator